MRSRLDERPGPSLRRSARRAAPVAIASQVAGAGWQVVNSRILLGILACGLRSQRTQPGVSPRDRCRSCGGSRSARESPWARSWCWTARGLRLPPRSISQSVVNDELERLDRGLEAARAGAGRDEAEVRTRLGPQYADILAAHSRMIADPTLQARSPQSHRAGTDPGRALHTRSAGRIRVAAGAADRVAPVGPSRRPPRHPDPDPLAPDRRAAGVVSGRSGRARDRADARPEPQRSGRPGPRSRPGRSRPRSGAAPVTPRSWRPPWRSPPWPEWVRFWIAPVTVVWRSWTATRDW